MPLEIEVVEQAILDALKNDAPVSAVVKTFDRYDGQFGRDDVGAVLGLLPGCFVTYVRDSLTAATAGVTYVQRSQFNVVVAERNLRGNFSGKLGATGALKLCELVHSALHKKTLGLADVFPPGLERLDRFPVLVTKELAVFEMSFIIRWVA